jgi:hypothetical protein
MRQAAAVNALPCDSGEMIKKDSHSFRAPGPSIATPTWATISSPLSPTRQPPSPDINVEIKMPESKETEWEKNERNMAMSLSHMCNE